jgi:hypothetical protein
MTGQNATNPEHGGSARVHRPCAPDAIHCGSVNPLAIITSALWPEVSDADIRTMITLPSWAPVSLIAAGALLSPVIAFFAALVVAISLGLLKEAGTPASLAVVVAGAVVYLLVRRLRAAPAGERLGGT